jgi:hypothetical protein
VNTPGTDDEIIAVFLAIKVLQSQTGRTGTRTLDGFHTSLSMSIVGSREGDVWEMKVLGPNGFAFGDRERASEIAACKLQRPSMHESDLHLNALVKGPIPHSSAPNPLVSFLVAILVANCAD